MTGRMEKRFLSLLFFTSFLYACATTTVEPDVEEGETPAETLEELEIPPAAVEETEAPVETIDVSPPVEVIRPEDIPQESKPEAQDETSEEAPVEATDTPTHVEVIRPEDMPQNSKAEDQQPKIIEVMKEDLQNASDFIEKVIKNPSSLTGRTGTN